MSTELLFGIVWMAIGLIFLLIVHLIRHFSEKGDSRCTAQAWATIIDVQEGTSQDSNGYEHTVYRPVYQFPTKWNEMVEAVSSMGYDKRTCRKLVGIQRKVLYDPENPIHFYTAEEKGSVAKLLKLFQILGVVLLIAGVIILTFPIWKNLLPMG